MISLFLKRWEIWILNLKLMKFSYILVTKVRKNMDHIKKYYSNTPKIIEWYIGRDKMMKKILVEIFKYIYTHTWSNSLFLYILSY